MINLQRRVRRHLIIGQYLHKVICEQRVEHHSEYISDEFTSNIASACSNFFSQTVSDFQFDKKHHGSSFRKNFDHIYSMIIRKEGDRMKKQSYYVNASTGKKNRVIDRLFSPHLPVTAVLFPPLIYSENVLLFMKEFRNVYFRSEMRQRRSESVIS